jgi:glycosyltransferase involved in cell wall biosynthesis
MCLAQALSEVGVNAQIMSPKRWKVREWRAWVQEIRQLRPDVTHLQFPSIGYRSSPLPHILGWARTGRCSVVTLHEHSALRRAQRVANRLFRFTADRLIFTTDYEANAFGATASPVIPIGSNVPAYPETLKRENTVLYFGQIRPNKGIEEFIALARLSETSDESWQFTVVGSPPPRLRDYSISLRVHAPSSLIWVEDAPLALVAKMMSMATVAYLPFPDGASFRRGSLIAALSNHLPVITSIGLDTSEQLRSVLLPAETPNEALAQLHRLRDNTDLGKHLGMAGRTLVQLFDWKVIANQHLALYRDLLEHSQ